MSKSSLRILAVMLTACIVLILFANLDGLPRDVKAQIAAERKAYTAAQSQLDSVQSDVTRTVSGESALFAPLPSAREYPVRLGRAKSSIAAAGSTIAELDKLEKQDR